MPLVAKDTIKAMALIDNKDVRLWQYPCVLSHHGVKGRKGMVCDDYPDLFPFLTREQEIMAIPVIGTFLGPAGIRVRADVFPD